MRNPIHIFIIDPKLKTIETVELKPEDQLQQVYNLIGCEVIEPVNFGRGDAVYVDEEGTFRKDLTPWFFMGKSLVGKGLIIGSDDQGEWTAPKCTIAEITEHVVFVGHFNNG